MVRQRLVIATLLFLGAFAVIAQLAWKTRECTPARASLHKPAARIWAGVAGPMAAGLLFLGISGAMLPGAEGFAESHYILNTALVLFLGYGWPILVGWTAVGLWFARVQEGRPATATKAAA